MGVVPCLACMQGLGKGEDFKQSAEASHTRCAPTIPLLCTYAPATPHAFERMRKVEAVHWEPNHRHGAAGEFGLRQVAARLARCGGAHVDVRQARMDVLHNLRQARRRQIAKKGAISWEGWDWLGPVLTRLGGGTSRPPEGSEPCQPKRLTSCMPAACR